VYIICAGRSDVSVYSGVSQTPYQRNVMKTTLATLAALLLIAGPLAAQQNRKTTQPKNTATAGTGNTPNQNSVPGQTNANGTKATSGPNATLEQNSAANASSPMTPAKTDARSSTITTGTGVKARTKRNELVNLKPKQ